jgi:3-oxoacyl-[acyl-carrier protein] reductase
MAGRVIVLTGASRGLGLAMAQALAEDGHTLVVASQTASAPLAALAAAGPWRVMEPSTARCDAASSFCDGVPKEPPAINGGALKLPWRCYTVLSAEPRAMTPDLNPAAG